MISSKVDEYLKHCLTAFMPDERLTVTEWSDKHRYLSQKSSSEAGIWRTARTPYLKEIMDTLSTKDPTQMIVFKKGSQIGGPLPLDTIVPTPIGFSRLDDIRPGDFVFDKNGKKQIVTGMSEVFQNDHCYEIEFDDGESIQCDARHLWTLEKFHAKKFIPVTVRTDEIGSLSNKNRSTYRLKVADPIKLPDQELPIGPYTLGCWLGDGNKHSNRITTYTPDSYHMAKIIESEGHHCEVVQVEKRWDTVRDIVLEPLPKDRCMRGHLYADVGTTSAGKCALCARIHSYNSQYPDSDKYDDFFPVKLKFGAKLRAIGVHRNKHIPDIYLRSSINQRTRLLQGLMDTDGWCGKGGLCEFYSSDHRLAKQVQSLICSLGMRASLKWKEGSKSGKGKTPTPMWIVRFTSYQDDIPAFSLPRKKERLGNLAHGRQWRTRYRYIKSIKRIDGFPTKCISVDSEDSLFLVGNCFIPTHNSECGLNWIGYVIDHSPAPIMMVLPTVEMSKRTSRQRIEPLIEECPSLLSKVGEGKSRDAANTMLIKEFPGGLLVLTGANSATGLRSLPARFIFADEIDAYPGDVDGEGDPVELAIARARTFSKRKIFLVSTPTIENRSRIDHYYSISDQRVFLVPCPRCNAFQELIFEQLRWQEGAPETARYHCIECDEAIENWEKTTMLSKGHWHKKNPDSAIAGFHLSSLYSPHGWFSWAEIADLWEKSQGKDDKLKSFCNTVLGDVFREKTDAPDFQRLYERRETYQKNLVPNGVLMLTAGADIQADRIEVEIVGWCRNKVSYSIDYRILRGDTTQPQVWNELAKLLYESFPVAWHESTKIGIKLLAVDSGYNTNTVYDWVRRQSTTRVVAVKGSDSLQSIIGLPKAKDINIKGKTLRRGVKVWNVGVSLAKSELYSWLRQPKAAAQQDEPYGYCHFPEYDLDYFKMLTAEELRTRIVKGYKRHEWIKVRDRNEALDARIYARAAASILGIDRWTEAHYAQLASELGAGDTKHIASVSMESTVVAEAPRPVPQQAKPKRKRESFW